MEGNTLSFSQTLMVLT